MSFVYDGDLEPFLIGIIARFQARGKRFRNPNDDVRGPVNFVGLTSPDALNCQ